MTKSFISKKNIILFIGWLIPLGISVWAIIISYNSNDISKQALILSQRPYITLKPVKFDGTDSYIFAQKINGGIYTKIKLQLTNTGNSIAKNIKTSDIFVTAQEIFPTKPQVTLQTEIKAQTPNPISLAPGESIFMEIEGSMPVSDSRAVTDILEKIKNNDFSFPFNIEVYYDTDLTPNIRGKTASSMIIKPKEIDINYTTLD